MRYRVPTLDARGGWGAINGLATDGWQFRCQPLRSGLLMGLRARDSRTPDIPFDDRIIEGGHG